MRSSGEIDVSAFPDRREHNKHMRSVRKKQITEININSLLYRGCAAVSNKRMLTECTTHD